MSEQYRQYQDMQRTQDLIRLPFVVFNRAVFCVGLYTILEYLWRSL